MKKIVSIKKTETNRFYDPEKVNNGGGYSQPLYNIFFDDDRLCIMDYSCGEFGTRYYAVLDSTNQGACWGTMLNGFVHSDFTNDDKELIDMVEEATGIRIPMKEEIGD